VVKAADEELATLELTATCNGERVLAQARAKIKQG
jgi:hypothetical protein